MLFCAVNSEFCAHSLFEIRWWTHVLASSLNEFRFRNGHFQIRWIKCQVTAPYPHGRIKVLKYLRMHSSIIYYIYEYRFIRIDTVSTNNANLYLFIYLFIYLLTSYTITVIISSTG